MRPPRIDDTSVFDQIEVHGDPDPLIGAFMLARGLGDLGYAGTLFVAEVGGAGRVYPLSSVRCLYASAPGQRS